MRRVIQQSYIAATMRWFRSTVLMSLASAGIAAAETAQDAATCDRAAAVAAQESTVPLAVLLAVTRTETGRARGGDLEPWPWAVNTMGRGTWFADRRSALDHASQMIEIGVRNLDIGCFQINYRWHGRAFPELRDMFDPVKNAVYAASFLADLYARTGDWRTAVGAYHSATPALADRYLQRYDTVLASIAADDPPTPDRAGDAPRQALISTEGTAARGSLVRLSDRRTSASIMWGG
ncbi:transglycosylase SLT domain-containing protein [Thalassococcus sp. CAU 1522]|uniref:Transglycosylase SLT domain-containing protein n=1 Tax=Thalassococcus arenae TaxID=2851652 RepID=A0ABS6N5Q1_9RHOB|nr:transglycosylase SLT domain-containing protein [Thalassococcus arenae]MBV2359344.1 transglycosylase SLT domain-containing protein [Thalassococcus arenae]